MNVATASSSGASDAGAIDSQPGGSHLDGEQMAAMIGS